MEFELSTLANDRSMSQRVVSGRCSSTASTALPCIHRPFEDPSSSCSGSVASRYIVPAVATTAFPDSTAALLHRRGAKAPSTDAAGGLTDPLQVSAVDWSNTASAGSAAATSAAAAAFCADGVDSSSSSDSELQPHSKDARIQNSSADDCAGKRMIYALAIILGV